MFSALIYITVAVPFMEVGRVVHLKPCMSQTDEINFLLLYLDVYSVPCVVRKYIYTYTGVLYS